MTRHDIEELKRILDAYAAADIEHERLLRCRQQIDREINAHHSVMNVARERACKALAKEGGTVTYGEQFWKHENGRISREPVRVNLDAIEDVKHGERTELHLTPPAEKAA